MKIKEVILEAPEASWYDKFRQTQRELGDIVDRRRAIAAQSPKGGLKVANVPTQPADGEEFVEPIEPSVDQPTVPTAQPKSAAQASDTKSKLAPGVTVVDLEPVVLQVGKKLYYIMDDGLWHEQNNRNPVDATWNQFLNNQMDIALLGKPSVAPTGERTPMQAQPASNLTPAQQRQQKQAAAAAQARSQMGIKQ